MTEKTDTPRAPYLEAGLQNLLPLSPVLNAIAASAICYGVYILQALNVGHPIIEMTTQGARFDGAAWAALVMSLIFGVAITMPATTQNQWRSALSELRQTLTPDGYRLAEQIAVGPPRKFAWRALLAFVCGASAGIMVNVWLIRPSSESWAAYWGSIAPWFDVMNPVLFGLGARGGLIIRYEDREIKALIQQHLNVDLAHLERNQVFGRLGLRRTLSWLVLTAIILLLFVESAPVPVSVTAVVLALVAAGYAFTSTIGPVVRKCTEVRDEALGEVRDRIRSSGEAMLGEAGSGDVRVSELTAYETWLEKLPVWPISAPVTRRLALYGFIPVLAWFGSAAAELVLNRFS